MRICCLLLLAVCYSHVCQGAFVVGLASPPAPGGDGGVATHLFRVNLDGSGFADLGAIEIGGVEGEFDGLAVRQDGQILSFQVTPAGSRLTAIDLEQATATLLSPPLFGREIRGATIAGGNQLWAIDSAANELLDVSMTTGEELGAVALTLDNNPFDVPLDSDIAIDFSGQLIMTAGNRMFSLDSQTGALTLLLTDTTGEGDPSPPAFSGAVVGMAPDQRVIALDSQAGTSGDFYTYDLASPTERTTLLAAPFAFEVAAGDLALLHQPANLGDYNGDGVVNLADYTVWRNALGSTTDLAANGNDFGASMNRIDEADYLVWKANFGTMPGSALLAVPSHPVPEAASSWLALAFGTLLIAKRRRGRCGR